MPDFPVRKIAVLVEEIRHEGGPAPKQPQAARRRQWRWSKTPSPAAMPRSCSRAMEDLKPLGLELTDRLIAALGGDVKRIDGYGKGAIVGTAGEIEHGALWHVPGGYAMRERLGDAKAIVPSAKKVGAFGSRLDVPLGHINAAYVRSHFDAMEVGISDGPRPDEILFVPGHGLRRRASTAAWAGWRPTTSRSGTASGERRGQHPQAGRREMRPRRLSAAGPDRLHPAQGAPAPCLDLRRAHRRPDAAAIRRARQACRCRRDLAEPARPADRHGCRDRQGRHRPAEGARPGQADEARGRQAAAAGQPDARRPRRGRPARPGGRNGSPPRPSRR